jgi:dTMP kinase
MKGKLLIIEGVDGSGKATQTDLLYQRLTEENYRVKKVEFPNYASESSALVKMYLNGDFGGNPEDISPYISSTFYVVDRYASYKKEWEEFYNKGGMIVADRYTTSNMIHQAAKIDNLPGKEAFLDWLYDFEYNIFGLPIPNSIVFLDMPPEYGLNLISKRANKSKDVNFDIHELNDQFLKKSYENAKWVANKYQWKEIRCISDSRVKSIQEINDEVYAYAKAELSYENI